MSDQLLFFANINVLRSVKFVKLHWWMQTKWNLITKPSKFDRSNHSLTSYLDTLVNLFPIKNEDVDDPVQNKITSDKIYVFIF